MFWKDTVIQRESNIRCEIPENKQIHEEVGKSPSKEQ